MSCSRNQDFQSQSLPSLRAGVRRLVHMAMILGSISGITDIIAVKPICAQEPADQNLPIEAPAQSQPPASEIEPASDSEIDEWIEMLGSERFAVRERAAMEFMREGDSVLPRLRGLANSTTDPEIRLRASELARQIERGDAEVKIAAFLAGKSDKLDGWGIAQRILGDTGSIRELYVEVIRAHPDIAKSLEGTSRDRAIAMTATVARITNSQLNEGRFPTRADAIAMLFPLVFDGVPIANDYERALIRVLRTEAGTLLHKSSTLSDAYHRLVGGWARRSGILNRQEVLWLLMDHDVIQALPLALDTLTQTNDAETLAIALQAIARFGDHRQASARITNLLHDDRPVGENGFVRGKPSRTELGDVAMATLAILYDIPLAEVGFEGASRDPKFGLRPEEVGFELSKKSKREETRKKVIAKITEKEADAAKPPMLVE